MPWGSQSYFYNSVPPGELAPPPPRVCFGRDEVIEKIVSLAENLTQIALIGAGGIGKTSIALAVLHHDRIKQRFGENRRFIRCDQFPASRTHFLSRLSKVIGAGVDNPEDLTPLRRFLSSREMILFLDNAESILDPQGTDAREIYSVVEELSRFTNLCLCITSRVSTVPPHFKRPDIPTLSANAACDIFYGIYDNGGRSDIISNLLEQLDFHALSITLLATTASHNMWDYDRLVREWDTRRTQVLRTDYNESLAATIELSLTSPTFRKLGPDAHDLLGIVAFFPQGINENNLDWLFPTIPNKNDIFDKFCVLSLAYRSNGFVMMLAPLRDHLCPKGSKLSTLLRTTKEHYFRRLSVQVYAGKPGFDEARWIASEDVNVEHLLDFFMSIDANSTSVVDACANFMGHLYWHKPRLIVLGPMINGLPDDHPSKPKCLFWLAWLFSSVGNYAEEKRLLIHALEFRREQRSDFEVAEALWSISGANLMLGLFEEGIQQVKEALGIYERLDDISGQARSLRQLAWLLYDDKQVDPAEEATSQVINLFSGKGEEWEVCECYRILGLVYRSKGNTEKAVDHLQISLGIASSFSWDYQLFWIHHDLAELFFNKDGFDNAYVHIEHAKLHTVNNTYHLGRAAQLQAQFWYKRRRFEEAESEARSAIDIYERLGVTKRAEDCRALLQSVERASWVPDSNGELLETVLLPTLLTLRS